MAIRSIAQLKSWFKKGLYPTEQHFADWLDSFWHRNDKIAMSNIDGLTSALNKKLEASDLKDLEDKVQENKDELEELKDKVDNREDDLEDLIDERMGAITHTYTLDFHEDGFLLQDVNLNGDVVIAEVYPHNVSRALISYGNVLRQEVDLTTEGLSIPVPDKSRIIWEIERTIENELACLGVKYTRDGRND